MKYQPHSHAFDDWFYGRELWSLRAERAYADLETGDPETIRKWLKAAWAEGFKYGKADRP